MTSQQGFLDESLSPGAGEVGPHLSPVLGPLSGPRACISGAGVPPLLLSVAFLLVLAFSSHSFPPHPCVSSCPHLGTVRGEAVAGRVGGEFMMEGRKELKSFRSE